MKQLFERFELQSKELEKMLEKSISLVRERKNPGQDLCEEISAAFLNLRSVYVEITEKLPEIADGTVAPKDASVKELEAFWQECITVKQGALKAVLAEFIRVYSDEPRYMEAIQSQLDAARDFLAQMGKDEKASLDVKPYVVFLECVKQDLNENEELSNMLEDEGIEGFSNRALMGLQKKKYHIREEKNVKQSVGVEVCEENKEEISVENNEGTVNPVEEVPNEKEAVVEVAEVEEGKAETEENNEVAGVFAKVTSELPETVSPLKPLKNVKTPSRKAFGDLANKLYPVFRMICQNLGCMQVASEKMITDFIRGSMSKEEGARVNVKGILNNLENKGYLASYKLPYKGSDTVVYCHTEMLRSCLQKDNYRQLITAKEDHKEKFPFATFVAKNQVSVRELTERLAKAEAVLTMFIYQKGMADIIKAMFCLWNEEKGFHTNRMTMQNRMEFNFVLVPHENIDEAIVFPTDADDILIVDMTGSLPNPELLPSMDGRRVFCINETWFYELTEGSWKEYRSMKEEDGEPIVSEAEEEPEEAELVEEPAAETVEVSGKHPEESVIDNDSVDSVSSEMVQEVDDSGEITEVSDSEVAEETEEPVSDDETAAYQEYYAKALEAFTKNLPHVGMTLLHALGQEYPEMLVRAERFGYALGDPLLEKDNRYQYLQTAFNEPFGQSLAYDALAFAAYLRLYFSPAAIMDPYSIGTIDYLSGNLILEESNAAKGLIYKLSQFTAKHVRGVDDNLLGQVIYNKGRNEQISELCSAARNLLEDRSCNWSKVSDTYKKLLEDGSVINTLLKMAAADNRSDAEKNKSIVRKYYHDNGVDYDSLSSLIEDTVGKLGKNYNQYTGSDRAFLFRNMSEPIDIVGQWFDLVENKHEDKADLISDTQELIKSCSQELETLSKFNPTSCDRDSEALAAYGIVKGTALYLQARLSGKLTQDSYKRYFYIDLLRAPFVALDGRYMPLIEKPEEQVAPNDFYNRVVLYINEDKKPWKAVVEKIFKFSADRCCYDFGNARLIKKYLEETGQITQWGRFDITREMTGLNSEDKKKQKQSPNAWQEEFNASIEMAEIDHWIDTLDSIRVDQLVDAQMTLYKNNANFGFFGRGLRNLLAYIQDKAVELKARFCDELDEQLENLDEVEKDKPIFEKIRNAIDKLRFGEARAFLDQVKSGNLDIRLYDQQSLGKVFADFIDEYPHLYKDSLRSNHVKLSVCYERAHPNRKNESAVAFLSAWPAEDGFISKEAVRKFVSVLGLPGIEPEYYIYKDNKNVCLVKFKEAYRTEYNHPIGNFGTRIERAGLNIAIVQGSDDVDEFYNEIEIVRDNIKKDRKNDSVMPTLLILVKNSIRLDVRRQLAGRYARNYNIDPFIIMDRVTAFYIAGFNQVTRWQHFLHCSLPFQPENPYSIDPNKEIPPEMFFGRSDKLLEIMHTEVAMLVYGGRQLGKTALLHQVRNHLKDVSSHRWASYVDIKGKDVEQAAVCIGKALQDGPEKFFFKKYNDKWKWSWDALIQQLTQRLTCPEDQVDNFFLIIDEADTFLMSSEKNNYRELEDLIALSNKTKTKTNENRFRFVLAGLHNVLRYSNSGNNNIITKIPPEIVPPLEREDARELLEIPLSYLGYDFGDMDSDVIAQIVHAANYFPGLIHVYAHILIKNKHKWFNTATTPFYSLSRNDFLRVLADPVFTNTMKERLDMTLKLDKDETGFYYILALLLANLFYAKEEQEFSRRGVSAKELQEHARGYNPNARISRLSDEEFANLLDELVQLTIFKREDDGEVYRYFFARTAFLTMLGRSKEVDDLLEAKMLEDG